MKKITKILLASLMCFSFAGCSKNDKKANIEISVGNEEERKNAKFPLTINDIEIVNLKFDKNEYDEDTLTSQYINNSKVAIVELISYYELPNGETISVRYQNTTLPGEKSTIGEEIPSRVDFQLNELKLIKMMVTFEPKNGEYYNCFEYDYKTKKYEAFHDL